MSSFLFFWSSLSNASSRLAYRSGVTVGITAPSSSSFLAGLSTAFNTGSPHKLADGAVVQDVAALHIAIDSSTPSVSTHIAALRNLLLGNGEGEIGSLFASVVEVCLSLHFSVVANTNEISCLILL